MHIERLSYNGWENCLRIANSSIEAIVTLDAGPRVIRFGFIGGENEFAEYPDQVLLRGDGRYHSYGGHRLWLAPEERSKTYYPDNAPVTWSRVGEAVHLLPPVESTTGVQKELELWIDPALCTFQVAHRITNRGDRPLTAAAWGISVMAQGGRAILPQEPYKPHPEALLPARPLVLWSYTRMNDPRFRWGEKYIQLMQQPGAEMPQKIGALNTQGWVGYVNGDRLFVKTVPYDKNAAQYPDFGSNVELFTNYRMLEVETLSPLRTLQPGETLQHDEHWFLFRNVHIGTTDEEIERDLGRIMKTHDNTI